MKELEAESLDILVVEEGGLGREDVSDENLVGLFLLMVLQVGEEEVEMKVVEVVEVDVLGLRIDVAILVLLI